MAAEVVEDDDIADCECWDQEVLDISQELLAVDRPIEDTGCLDAIEPERGQEGQGASAPVRRLADQALAAPAPAAQGLHVGLNPGFVPRDRLCRPEDRL